MAQIMTLRSLDPELLQHVLLQSGTRSAKGGTTSSSDLNLEPQWETLLDDPNLQINVEDLLAASQRQVQMLDQAEQYFQQAVDRFRRAAAAAAADDIAKSLSSSSSSSQRLEYQHALATALQNWGTTAFTRGGAGPSSAAVALLEEALDVYETTVVPQIRDRLDDAAAAVLPVPVTDTYVAVAEVLYTLSDIYLQLGNYDAAKEMYQKASKYWIWMTRFSLDGHSVNPFFPFSIIQ